jgi:hypothetical protein
MHVIGAQVRYQIWFLFTDARYQIAAPLVAQFDHARYSKVETLVAESMFFSTTHRACTHI